MAITTDQITATGNSVSYSSSGGSAITFMSFCNYGTASAIVQIYLVPDGVAVSDANIILKDLEIIAGETYILYHGGEKILLDNADSVNTSVTSTGTIGVTVVTSYASF